MLENNHSALRGGALEANLKGLIEALETMHNRFRGTGVGDYCLTPIIILKKETQPC